MLLQDCIYTHIDSKFLSKTESKAAIDEFMKIIPGRVLECEVDETKTNKQGVTKNDSVYKFGISLENNMAFIEFFENRSQGRPTMGIYADKAKPAITIKGNKLEKEYLLYFSIENGNVKKLSKLT